MSLPLVLRFAPSPTGFMHLGNIRIALMNFLYSRKNSGKLILRLDDTDFLRSRKECEDLIKYDLDWLGISYDQYEKQSLRIERYTQVFNKLKEQGSVYPCYETKDELEFARKAKRLRGMPPVYDRSALNLTSKKIAEFEKEGRKPHWRFKLDDCDASWDDFIKGEIKYDLSSVSDPVLVKEDGDFLYTLPSVVDDVDFGVNFVIRGEDHVTNTAVQIQILKKISSDYHIDFAHISLMFDISGGPLSKRTGDLSVKTLRAKGIEPMTINSYLSAIGTSRSIEPFYEMKDIIDLFSIEEISASAPKFLYSDLENLNKKVLAIIPFNLIKNRLADEDKIGCDDYKIKELWEICQHNINIFDDFKEWILICFDRNYKIDPEYTKEELDVISSIQKGILLYSSNNSQSSDILNDILKILSEYVFNDIGIKGKKFFVSIRKALTGKDHGPHLDSIVKIMGNDIVLERIKDAIKN